MNHELADLRAELEALGPVVKAARTIRRGCNCDYDYRCSNCDRVVDLMAAIKEYDK
jgi:hypothetical protein